VTLLKERSVCDERYGVVALTACASHTNSVTRGTSGSELGFLEGVRHGKVRGLMVGEQMILY
jgi:hypothetical protein